MSGRPLWWEHVVVDPRDTGGPGRWRAGAHGGDVGNADHAEFEIAVTDSTLVSVVIGSTFSAVTA